MKSEHTPGPWRVAKWRNGFLWVDSSVTDEGVALCGDGSWVGPCEANARLIAAAPDMLQALADILRHTDECQSCNGHMAAIDAIARQAIAKARGE